MFKVYDLKDAKWLDFIENFKNKDIYYDSDYYKSLSKYLNAKIFMLCFEKGDERLCEVVQINDIHDFEPLSKYVPKDTYFDMETPYGYGGILANNISSETLKEYYNHKENWAKRNNIVSEFIRYNPILNNNVYSNDKTKQINEKSTIYIDLASKELIVSNMDSKNRNMVRKAIRSGVEIKVANEDNLECIMQKFKELYFKTMQRNNANKFYYFDEEYFNQFIVDMKGKFKLFYAVFEEKIIATSLFIFNNENIHYYLSGADREYMKLAPNNLLLFEVANWACENGFKKFHLGGGVSNNDMLYGFKKQFNRNGQLDFYIGCQIYNKKAFDFLVSLREKNEDNFDMERRYLIKYRQEENYEKENIYNS